MADLDTFHIGGSAIKVRVAADEPVEEQATIVASARHVHLFSADEHGARLN